MELEVIDYPQISLSLLIERFKDSTNFQKILAIISENEMDIQTTVLDISERFVLPSASGAELTILGTIWDAARKDVSDAEYRSRIQVKATLTISGTIPELKRYIHTFYELEHLTYTPNYPAGYTFTTDARISQVLLDTFTGSGIQSALDMRIRIIGEVNALSSVISLLNPLRGVNSSVISFTVVEGTMNPLRGVESLTASVSTVPYLKGSIAAIFSLEGNPIAISSLAGLMNPRRAVEGDSLASSNIDSTLNPLRGVNSLSTGTSSNAADAIVIPGPDSDFIVDDNGDFIEDSENGILVDSNDT